MAFEPPTLRVEQELGQRPAGPVRMLTQVRTLGYVFNPVTLYYCFERSGQPGSEALQAVVAEITNTPWGERHSYVLAADPGAGVDAGFAKRFHVSPFMPMEQMYRWRLSVPDEKLLVHMQNREGSDRVFDASLCLERQPLTRGALHRTLRRHPAMALRVHGTIYAHALSLVLKGVPFHRHPRKRAALAAETRSP